MSSETEDLEATIALLNERIEDANKLSACSADLLHVTGYSKLHKKIKAELKFLNQLKNSNNFRREHLQSSNLSNLSAIVKVAQINNDNISALYYPIKCQINGIDQRQQIDIVTDGGKTWIKVIARNPFALERICSGDSEYGVRTVVDQAKDLLEYSLQNLHHYIAPQIMFYFVCGVTSNLYQKLSRLNVQVQGDILESKIDDSDSDDDCDLQNVNQNIPSPVSNCLNIDVSTMISYVSALTNGGANYRFKEVLLNEEAAAERIRPVKPILDELFEGKVLCACQLAVSEFKRICECIAGEDELERAEILLRRIKVVPDNISELALRLPIGGRVKKRSQVIFGTGDSIRASTVTANTSFVRAAAGKGVKFSVFEHEARALSSRKQLEPLVDL